MAGPNRGMPGTHRYSQADLRPTLRDPRCSPQFPLACYWPVYLGNFWCDVYPQHATRIQEYFGSKGLLVRMVFARNEYVDPYFKEQKRCKCYDFLVYFVSQQDAQDAVHYCNRDMYYGHRLNVLPGRTPVPFDVGKSAKHTLVQPDRMNISEQVFERYINEVSGAQVSCVVRHTREDLLVQYATPEDRHKAIQTCQIGVPGLIFIYQAKQRFLEQNVEMELVKCIESNPSFMDMLPPTHVLQALFNGRFPDVDQRWKTADTLRPSKKLKIEGRKEYRRILNRRICGQARNLFGVFCEFEHFVSEEVHLARIRKLLKKKAKRAKRLQMNKNGSESSN